MKIHHIGYLVKSMEKAQKTFTELGYRIEQETVYDDYRQIDICFLEKDGYRIELVCPGTATSKWQTCAKRSVMRPTISVMKQMIWRKQSKN